MHSPSGWRSSGRTFGYHAARRTKSVDIEGSGTDLSIAIRHVVDRDYEPSWQGMLLDGEIRKLWRNASTAERHPDHPRQLGFAIRLGQQQHAGIEATVMHDRVLGISGREQRLQ